MLNTTRRSASFSVNDIQKATGVLWQDAGSASCRRPGRHPRVPLSGGTKALMYPKPITSLPLSQS